MSAAERIAELDTLPAEELCARTDSMLKALVKAMNEETTLLRTGKLKEAEAITAEKARVAQDYVVLARAVQRAAPRLKAQAPELLKRLRNQHESLATQMAENLRVLASARTLTQSLLSDLAKSAGPKHKPNVYSANGAVAQTPPATNNGLSLNKSL